MEECTRPLAGQLSACTQMPVRPTTSSPIQQPALLKEYDVIIQDHVKQGVVEVITDPTPTDGRAVHYIPHHAVRRLVCRRFEGRPCSAPIPPPLPDFRVQRNSPLTSTGVDFAGQLYVKATGNSRSTKVWICLYTCCTVRAVHLDLVPDLTTPTFLRSLKRLSARHGLLRRIVSDNGKTFKAAAKAIQAIMKSQQVQKHLTGLGVEWKFNVERAPWWEGILE